MAEISHANNHKDVDYSDIILYLSYYAIEILCKS